MLKQAIRLRPVTSTLAVEILVHILISTGRPLNKGTEGAQFYVLLERSEFVQRFIYL